MVANTTQEDIMGQYIAPLRDMQFVMQERHLVYLAWR